jgi:hypothetical protein
MPKDVIKVYNAAVEGKVIGSGTVGTYDTDITISVTKLASDGGKVYISVTNYGKGESKRVKVHFIAED